jgi:hypothetical protein
MLRLFRGSWAPGSSKNCRMYTDAAAAVYFWDRSRSLDCIHASMDFPDFGR